MAEGKPTIFRPYNPSSGHRSDRSAGDRLRHRQKVRKAIQENIADIIAEESIIGKDRDRIVKVPIRGVKEYRFIYGDNQSGIAEGDGTTTPGQVVGKREAEGKGSWLERVSSFSSSFLCSENGWIIEDEDEDEDPINFSGRLLNQWG